VFPAVGVDFTYYAFPNQSTLNQMAQAVPAGFQFGFEVTDIITIKKYTQNARFGQKAGERNGDYLNADLFAEAFLKPLEALKPFVGVLMFEFSKLIRRITSTAGLFCGP